MDTNFENFLANFSFLILFISMLVYWIQASNFETNNTTGVLISSFPLFPKAFPVHPSGISPDFPPTGGKGIGGKKNPYGGPTTAGEKADEKGGKDENGKKLMKEGGGGFNTRTLGTIMTMVANASLFLLLVLRWKESGHFPLSNLYESLMFLSWSLTSIHLFIEIGFSSYIKEFQGNGGQGVLILDQRKAFIASRLIGSITAPSALFTNAFATFSLPKEMQEASPLVPALQSNWLMMHVTVMILSYAALILGSLLSIGFLVITGGENINLNSNSPAPFPFPPPPPPFPRRGKGQGEEGIGENIAQSTVTALTFQQQSQQINLKTSYRLNLAKTLDNLSYRVLGLGFPLLTIGILSGAVWANEAWGSYWSWDPKETWALLTWLVFAIYLHTRLTKGWEGKKPALIASLGFVTVWVCFLGVNLIGEGLHSYGWMAQS